MKNLFDSTPINFENEIEVNLNSIIQDIDSFTREILEEHTDKRSNYLNIIGKVCETETDKVGLKNRLNKTAEKTKAKLFDWLKVFGLLNSDNKYSERLIASMHYFYLNKKLQIKKIELLPKEWTPDSGDLTPTLKLKRKIIAERNKTLIEKMYTER